MLLLLVILGDELTATGIIRTQDNTSTDLPSILQFYMETISVVSNKSRTQKAEDDTPVQLDVSDYHAVEAIYDKPQLFRLLVHSLCPSIYGHEIVKAALILALFGGTHEENASRRSLSHVLMVSYMIGEGGLA